MQICVNHTNREMRSGRAVIIGGEGRVGLSANCKRDETGAAV